MTGGLAQKQGDDEESQKAALGGRQNLEGNRESET